MNMNRKMTSGIFVLAVSFFISTPAYGATQYSPDTETITYLFDYIFAWEDNDSSAPSGDVHPPWLTASFQQMYKTQNDDNSYDGYDGVKLTLDSEGLPDYTSYVTDWYFNFDPSLDINKLSIVFNSEESSDSLANISVQKQTDGFAVPGGGHPSYDIKVSVQINNNNDGWFYQDRIGVFDITYDNNPVEFKYTSFDFLSEPNSNNTDLYLAAAKVQGIDEVNNNGWSASIAASGQPIPEPATLLLLGIGIMALSPLLKRFAGNRSRGN